MRKMGRKVTAACCIGCLAFLAAACLLAPALSSCDPNLVNPLNKFAGMSGEHPLGTDYLGRDLLARLLWGGRNTLGYAAAVTAASSVIGTAIGMISGFLGGAADRLIMRGSDVLRAFPGVVLVLIIVSILGVGIGNVCIALLLTRWIWYARMARNLTKEELSRPSILAGRLAGSGWGSILIHHVFPSILPQMLSVLSIDFGGALLSISGYSFLGLGILPPEPEWGMMISDGRSYMDKPGMMFWPGICILIVVISVNVLGDLLRDILEEKRT